MKNRALAGLGAIIALATVQPASAAIVWADLTATGPGTVTGTVGGVGVTYTGDVTAPTRVSGPGINYWAPTFPASDGPATGPDPADIIVTDLPGLKTVTFAAPVTDVYLALNSWNGQVADFDTPFTVYAEGCGYWGCGTALLGPGDTLTGLGELHGILKFTGTFTSISYVDAVPEYWHGIQIGIGSAVPEPSSWALMIAGFGLAGAALRRRRQQRATVHYA